MSGLFENTLLSLWQVSKTSSFFSTSVTLIHFKFIN
jgi:hypothetical protein